MTSKSENAGAFTNGLTVSSAIKVQLLVVRGHWMLLTQQLAARCGVEAKVLNQAVRRNLERFLSDFMFQLKAVNLAALGSKTVTLNAQVIESKKVLAAAEVTNSRGSHVKCNSYAFTEQCVAISSSILRSERAIAVNIELRRTFVKLRGMLSEHADLKRKLNAFAKKYDNNFSMVFAAIHQLMDEPKLGAYSRHRIGFTKTLKLPKTKNNA